MVAAWNGLAISGLCAAGLLLDEPGYVDAAVAAGELLACRVHTVGRAPAAASRGTARWAGTPRSWRTSAAWRPATSPSCRRPATPVWLERARVLLDDALARFRAEDGGFFDTAADAEALVARPRDPSDNASPSGLSATVHALAEYAALTGSGRHRRAAEEAVATVAALAERVPRFAGWSLAAAEAMLDGPLEVAVVGPVGAERDALEHRARQVPGAVVVVADGPREDIPLLSGRTAVDGRPAAYVCRGQVCERPVTDPAELP